MKKFYFLFIFIIIYSTNGLSQNNYYYYYKKQKISLQLDMSTLNISLNTQFTKNQLVTSNFLDFNVNIDKSIPSNEITKFAKIEFVNTPSELIYYQNVNLLKNISTVITVNPSFLTLDGQKIGMSNYLYVKLKNISDLTSYR